MLAFKNSRLWLLFCLTVGVCGTLTSCTESPEEGVQRVLDEDIALSRELQNSNQPEIEAIAQYVSALSAIDTESCPPDFREAFQAHVNAWQGTLNELRSQPRGFWEGAAVGVVNSLLGEADGGVSRMAHARRYWGSRLQDSWYRVTQIAAKYGAKVKQPD